VLCWSAAGAITHPRRPGEVNVPDDVLDMTYRRPTTFFETSGLGRLRQFPVFCPTLAGALTATLEGLGLPAVTGVTAAVTEGPRYETPAEVRMLGNAGAEIVTHTLVPEVFLAKELQMCFAGACYLVGYAETGSAHRPFSGGELFGGLTQAGADQGIARVKDGLTDILFALLERLPAATKACHCEQPMAEAARRAGLGDDWRTWFD